MEVRINPSVKGLGLARLYALSGVGTGWYQSRQDDGMTRYGKVDIRTVDISFRIGGRLASLNVDEGATIKAGQVLSEQDHAPYEHSLIQATPVVSVAQSPPALLLAGFPDAAIDQAPAPARHAQAAEHTNHHTS
ncbi:biotin/lipoyl-binding protein, partial [Salmonella enterica]|uniref:biotin/lipoyl-binding protein n=1 Tax=Salmonella enterica TaxID=28901 RepID=UPI00398C4413